MSVSNWMAWEGGVDLAGTTSSGLAQPNLIVHVARVVHTPLGSAPSGMLLWQPDPAKAPLIAAFVSTDARIGSYFGPNIFRGTPFEKLPCLPAKISVGSSTLKRVTAHTEAGGHVFEIELSDISPTEMIQRAAGALPFAQQGLEAAARRFSVKVDGKVLDVNVPPQSPSGAPGAVWSPFGMYAR